MSNWFSRRFVAAALLGGLLWIADHYSSQIAAAVPFDFNLLIGLLFAVVVGWGQEIIMLVLSISILWQTYQDPRSVTQLDYLPVISNVAGILFLVITPFTSGIFYYIIPQPQSQFALIFIRELSVIGLISSILLEKLLFSSTSPIQIVE
jgi:hypothetical protein